ncbi:hypothetical protein PENTCL1PPCAC_15425, partial [Pristionchus entomophagus]
HIHHKIGPLINLCYTSGSAIPVTISVFVVRRKVIRILSGEKGSMSEQTANMHRTLVKVLTQQACLPVLFAITVSGFIMEKCDLFHSPFIENFILVVSM